MSELQYISEEDFKKVVDEEIKRTEKEGKNHIRSGWGFAQHLVSTGNNAEKAAELIRNKHPSLGKIAHPGLARAGGFMHDFGRYNVGDPFHEIDGAYTILMRGEELELVYGGTKEERRNALKVMASCLPCDGIVFEQLGGIEFPEKILEKGFYTPEMDMKLQALLSELSNTNIPLPLHTLTSPRTLIQRIVMYADFKDLEGEDSSLDDRMEEVYQRYNEIAINATPEDVKKYSVIAPNVTLDDFKQHYRNVPYLLKQTMPRTIDVINSIDELLM